MKKLIYDPACRGKEVRFTTSQELAFWLSSRRNGTLFAVNEHASIVYTVIKLDRDAWAISCHSGFYKITFDKLVEQYDLYFIDDDQMIALIKAL